MEFHEGQRVRLIDVNHHRAKSGDIVTIQGILSVDGHDGVTLYAVHPADTDPRCIIVGQNNIEHILRLVVDNTRRLESICQREAL